MRLLLSLLFIIALLTPLGPPVLLCLRGGFEYAYGAVTVFILLVLERVWSMFFRMRQRFVAPPRADWTAVSVGYAYLGVVLTALLELMVFRRHIIPAVFCGALPVYLAAVALRYWAFSHLRHQWTIHIDDEVGERVLIKSGPYRYIRHPIYSGAILESLAFALMFNSPAAFIMALTVFMPLELQRARREEKLLRATFGAEYEQYAEEIPAFLPYRFGGGRG